MRVRPAHHLPAPPPPPRPQAGARARGGPTPDPPALSARARDALRVLAADPGATGIFTDFDGTIAPIVEDPAAARPLPGALDALDRLARRFAVVAVISGRPAAFLARHLELGEHPGLVAYGLYGLERADGPGGVTLAPEAERWRSVFRALARAARGALPEAVRVEDKGLGLALHWRAAPAAEAACGAFARDAARAHGLRLLPARMAVELGVPGAHDKGSALAAAAAGLAAACFIGDDAGDLAAFRALEVLASRGLAPVRVAVESPEAPAALVRAADCALAGPEAVLAFLDALARAS